MGLWGSKPALERPTGSADGQFQIEFYTTRPAPTFIPTPAYLQAKQDTRLNVAMIKAASAQDDWLRESVGKDGVDVNGRLHGGETMLTEAASHGQTATCRLLVLELGADPDKIGSSGYTALQNAFRKGHKGTALCLVKELGADPGCYSALGSCLLRFSRSPEADAFLVRELKVDPNSTNEKNPNRIWSSFGNDRLYSLASAAWGSDKELEYPYRWWLSGRSPLTQVPDYHY